ncbi:MAG: DUF3047 domain-containing protein [Polaromonas sp.]|nr:DUF3047 domain-containing protein [Polaromonas sp.]MBP6142634.1 DUF3047 domain-containing protein [Polaromonas sp.]MBP7308930.1 DUF3047 domain-containing protein [Polaromonas sp.]MBP8874028.1 DUF3047 domain-containing protein [Polaromonas sp.]
MTTENQTDSAPSENTPRSLTWQVPASWQLAEGVAGSTWQHFTFPGKTPTNYKIAHEDGRDAIWASSQSTSSAIRSDINIDAKQIGKLKFSWKVPAHLLDADVTVPELDDSPVRVFLTFEGDRSKFSAKNALVSEMANLLLGEPLPYATLVYLWSKQQPLGSVILGQRTDRVRNIVIETGSVNLNKWMDYERDIGVDFEKAFGEKPGKLLRIALMTDSDNTKSQTTAWYGAPSFIVK